MLPRILVKFCLSLTVLCCAGIAVSAQTFGSYAPYSIYGIGDLASPGTAYNKTMGGVGIAARNNAYINILNPAAVTARDSLAFMADFSLYSDNKIFRQGDMKSSNNVFNIGDLVMSFPIYKSSAFMVGIAPYSGTGFGYQFYYEDPMLIGKTGNISYSAQGLGAIYQAFVGAGVTFFKRISLGAELLYYFGETEKHYSTSFVQSAYSGIENGSILQVNALSGKFGVQYEQPVGRRSKIGIGATYTLGSNMKGYFDQYSYTSATTVDTLYYKSDTLGLKSGLSFAPEIGVGVSFNCGDNWMVEFDYTRSDWTKSGVDKYPGLTIQNPAGSGYSSFSAAVSQTFRFGFEFTPNKNDVRYYFNKVTYRGGAYYRRESFKVDGHDVNAFGFTLGLTLPVYRLSNGITLGLDFGRRGSVENNLIKENYFNFNIGFNLYDIWFHKNLYE